MDDYIGLFMCVLIRKFKKVNFTLVYGQHHATHQHQHQDQDKDKDDYGKV